VNTLSLHDALPICYKMLIPSQEKFSEVFRQLGIHFPKRHVLNVTDMPELCEDTNVFQTTLKNGATSLRVDSGPRGTTC
jgi:hypothetical protein